MRAPTEATLAVIVLLGTLLAGCAAGGATPANGSRILVQPETPQGNASLLRVLVISDEYLPVPAARVFIVGLGLNASTSESGEAYFQIVQPGRYAVHVHHTRYYPNTTKVLIEPGARIDARVWLRDAPDHRHYSDFRVYDGVCAPIAYVKGSSETAYCPETPYARRPYARWYLGPGLVGSLIYLSWSPSPASPATMRVELRFPEAGPFANGNVTLAKSGPTPVKLVIPEALVTPAMKTNGNVVEIRVGLPHEDPIGLNAYQPFRIEAQFDYYLDPPDVDPEY